MIPHTLEQCQKGIHIKSFKEQKSTQFMCRECKYIIEAIRCPSCDSIELKKESNGTITCQNIIDYISCNNNFGGHLDIIDDDMPEKSILEKILEEDDGKHPHEKGLRRGIVYRDYE